MNIIVTELLSSKDCGFNPAMQIVKESFVRDERDKVSHFKKDLEKKSLGKFKKGDNFHFFLALDKNEVVGLTQFVYWHKYKIGYGGYLAVAPTFRNKGIGSYLYKLSLKQIKLDATLAGDEKPIGYVFEVQKPELAKSDDDKNIREKRISFYRSLGADIINGVDFIAPPLFKGAKSVPFYLMFHSFSKKDFESSKFKKRIVKAIYKKGYNLSRKSIRKYLHKCNL